jgi:hypothetical protein
MSSFFSSLTSNLSKSTPFFSFFSFGAVIFSTGASVLGLLISVSLIRTSVSSSLPLFNF